MTTVATDFVGREADLRDLLTAVRRSLTGRASLALVSGEAGIGKTRLVEEAAAQLRDDGGAILWAACWEGDGAPAYWPWTQVVRAGIDLPRGREAIERLGPRRGELARLLPELGDAAPADGEAIADVARFPFFDAVGHLLTGTATPDAPVTIVLDDLHWADRPSLRLLAFLARELRPAPIALVGTFRDAEALVRSPQAVPPPRSLSPHTTRCRCSQIGLTWSAHRVDATGLLLPLSAVGRAALADDSRVSAS